MPTTARNGIALFAALSLLVLLGLLTAAAFASTTLSQRTTRLAQHDAQLAAAADYAATSVLTDSSLALLSLGSTRTQTIAIPGSNDIATTVAVTRLPSQLLWIVADAELTGFERAHRRVALIARFPSPGPLPPAALVTPGQVALDDSVQVSTDSSGDRDCRTSNSPSIAHPADSSAYYMTARQLAALDSSPVVRHVRGDTTIAGGTYSGILIVDGNVALTGVFQLEGLLIAHGRIDVRGSIDARGALMAFSPSASAIHVAGGFVRYDPCTIGHVFRTAFAPRPIRSRSWAELF